MRTTKILAVAVVAAGCSTSTTAPPVSSAAVRVAALPPVMAEEVAAAPEPLPEETAPAPAPERPEDMHEAEERARSGPLRDDPKLLGLASELANIDKQAAFAELARFRPLCNAEGYPLVGNVVRKAAFTYTTTAFCRDVRGANEDVL